MASSGQQSQKSASGEMLCLTISDGYMDKKSSSPTSLNTPTRGVMTWPPRSALSSSMPVLYCSGSALVSGIRTPRLRASCICSMLIPVPGLLRAIRCGGKAVRRHPSINPWKSPKVIYDRSKCNRPRRMKGCGR